VYVPFVAVLLAVSILIWNSSTGAQQEFASSANGTFGARLLPTAHPAVPATLETMWYVPEGDAAPTSGPLGDLARGVRMLDKGEDPALALPLVSNPALADTDVADYAHYYSGMALERLSRLDAADAQYAEIDADKDDGYLSEAAGYRRAELRESKADFAGAAQIYEGLLRKGVASPQIALVKLGAASSAAGNRDRAIEAHRRVLREYPLSAEAPEAEQLLDRLGGFVFDSTHAVNEELDRAEALFKAKRWSQVRSAYSRIENRLSGTDRDRATLRIAQADAADGRHRQAREVFRRFLSHPTLASEAQFANVFATRALGEDDEFKQLVEDAVARNPTHPLAEEALNELARYYVLDNNDGKAAEVYARLVEKFPTGAYAERAVWKAGWWAYRQQNYRETIRFFEHGAAAFPRSDFRPSWLYWGARAHDALGNRAVATERFRLAATDYLNTYYGRLSWDQLQKRNEATVTPGVRRAIVTPPPPPPNVERIKRLIELGLYRPALNELQYAAKMWGDSAPLQATTALVHHKLGNLRPAIQTMKRAYPQYMTAGGEMLPDEIHRILFPLDYWPQLQAYARSHDLDPYLVAALVGQESTFDASIRSSANAIGLMQVMPATGRQYAKKLGISGFSEQRLTDAEINMRIGTQYLADLFRRFAGKAHYVIASYNAGEHRVDRWRSERGDLPQDEFIDDIPYPETQNYVKRILGTAEDYRRLYGPNGIRPGAVVRPAPSAAKKPTAAAAKKSSAKKSPPTKRKPTATKKKAPTKAAVKKAPVKKAPVKKAPAKKTTRRR
jgi:soluble lytic murein transglycosylase